MAAEMFQIDQKDLKMLRKFYKRAPQLFARASAGILNDFAFGTKTEIEKLLKNRLTIRNQAFLRGSIRVQKADGKVIDRQKSKVGSVTRPRFSGWLEQQTGKKDPRSHKPTIFARRGNKFSAVPPGNRLKQSSVALRPEDFNIRASNDKTRTIIFLQIMRKKSRGRPFYIKKKYKKLRRGIYKMQGGRIRRLHSLDRTKKKIQSFDWINQSRKNFFAQANIRNLWGDQLRRVLKLR